MAHGPISNEVLLAIVESSYGVDPTPTAASNAILMRNFQIVPFEQLRMFDREAVRASLGTLQHIYGGSLGACRFDCEVKGSGTIDGPPEIAPLLRGSGFAETINAGASVVYAPASVNHSSVTLYAFEFGRVRHIFSGARGTFSLRYETGGALMASFEMIGKRGTVTDQSQPTPTIDSTVPQAVKGLATTIGGVSGLVVQEYELAMNNRISVPPNLNDSEGFGNVTIVKRDPTISMLLHAELIATLNPFADLTAGTARAIVSGTLGGTAGNRFALSCPQTHYRGVELGEAEGFRNRRHVFGCHEAAADSEVTLTFT